MDPSETHSEFTSVPGSPMAKTQPCKAGGGGSIPGQGTKIQHASWPKDRNNIVTNSIKTFKMVQIKKKNLKKHLLKIIQIMKTVIIFFLNRDEDGL